MRNWNDITLYKFQQIEAINASERDAIDKLLFITCALFNLTEYELDNYDPNKAAKLINKVNTVFSGEVVPVVKNRIGRYVILQDINTMTFGQYVELAYFLQGGIHMAQYSMASISRVIGTKYKAATHRARAEFFFRQPVPVVLGTLARFNEGWRAFNNEYAGLFGLNTEVTGPDAPADKFNKRYGWIYSASQVAEYERITLEKVWDIPARQALNDLSYLKAKGIYEHEQLKRK